MSSFAATEIDRGNRRYIASTMREGLLEREREFDLARRWRKAGDSAALHELTRAYARFVVSIAARFRGYGLPFGDLIQEGNIGLMEAAARFDPEHNARFSTYAGWWIMAAIQDYVLRHTSMVRLATSPGLRRLFFNLRRARARHATGVDGTLTDADRERVASQLQVSVDDVEHMEAHLAGPDSSLDNTLSREDGSETFVDRLVDDRPGPEDLVLEESETRDRGQKVSAALAKLTLRERQIIEARFFGERRTTLGEIGQGIGVSKERVRQIEAKALAKLRVTLAC